MNLANLLVKKVESLSMSVSIVPWERTLPPQAKRRAPFVDLEVQQCAGELLRNIMLEVSPRKILCYHWRLHVC